MFSHSERNQPIKAERLQEHVCAVKVRKGDSPELQPGHLGADFDVKLSNLKISLLWPKRSALLNIARRGVRAGAVSVIMLGQVRLELYIESEQSVMSQCISLSGA